jgi:hypothetical protein
MPFFDFDTRVMILTEEINDSWEDKVKELHHANRKRVVDGLITGFGDLNKEAKLENFIALNTKPFSIIAFHNRFFEQARSAFVIGAYYPALTGACALGERILNHMLLLLREDYKYTPEYRRVYRKDSFDDWTVPIETLKAWDVLLPDVVDDFLRLKEMRNRAIHFRPETDHNDRELALEALNCLRATIGSQFASLGTQPWFLTGVPGEVYIKQAWEQRPFIQKVYLPNCALVGPKHRMEALVPRIVINDRFDYEEITIPDDQFCQLRKDNNGDG